jgi:hypothetical protein
MTPTRNLSGDRTEFIGRNRFAEKSGCHAAGAPVRQGRGRLDPCAAIQVNFELADGQEREIVFRLGVGRNAEDAGQLVQRFRGVLAARTALEAVWAYWNHTLGAVQVETPDPALNVLANGWLVYQTLACRLWARSGYYQSGGAFGFRDQLQDVMALVHAQPGLVREHLLLAASRQFHRRRCPALVASTVGPWRAHDLFGRLSLVAPGGLPLRDDAPAIAACSMSPCLFSKVVRSTRKTTPITICPAAQAKWPASTNTACARSATVCASASAACR